MHEVRRWRLDYVVGETITLRVSDGFFFGIEVKAYFSPHVVRAGPSHERIRFLLALRVKLKHPFLGACAARLHSGLCWLVDSRGHERASSIIIAGLKNKWDNKVELLRRARCRTLDAVRLLGAACFGTD